MHLLEGQPIFLEKKKEKNRKYFQLALTIQYIHVLHFYRFILFDIITPQVLQNDIKQQI